LLGFRIRSVLALNLRRRGGLGLAGRYHHTGHFDLVTEVTLELDLLAWNERVCGGRCGRRACRADGRLGRATDRHDLVENKAPGLRSAVYTACVRHRLYLGTLGLRRGRRLRVLSADAHHERASDGDRKS